MKELQQITDKHRDLEQETTLLNDRVVELEKEYESKVEEFHDTVVYKQRYRREFLDDRSAGGRHLYRRISGAVGSYAGDELEHGHDRNAVPRSNGERC